MRKTLIGALSVAGLMATILAIASGPATSQTVVVFQTDTHPGTYTVSWETQGSCDPSKPDADTTLATDGASGTVSRTVSVPAGTANTASILDATPVEAPADGAIEFSVSTAAHCTYEWTATFTSNLGGSNGISCLIAVGTGTADRSGAITPADGADSELEVTTGAGSCTSVSTINVNIQRGDTNPTSGAVLNTTFTATATPVDDSNDECAAVTEESEVDDKDTTIGSDATDDDTVGIALKVLETPLSDATELCEYDVSVDVPAGFVANPEGSNEQTVDGFTAFSADPATSAATSGGASETSAATDDPTHCGTTRYVDPATGEGNATDAAANTQAVEVECRYNFADIAVDLDVAVRSVYILQNVVGDSGDANAKYTLTENKACSIPDDLPGNLTPNETGGIRTLGGETVVELREGFFNISAAVMGRTVSDVDANGRTFAPRNALNEEADHCSFTAAVSDMPDNCSAAEGSITANAVSGADGNGRVIVSFDITCSADTGADDGDMDMGADDGDMDMGADDGDMGPPEDVATG